MKHFILVVASLHSMSQFMIDSSMNPKRWSVEILIQSKLRKKEKIEFAKEKTWGLKTSKAKIFTIIESKMNWVLMIHESTRMRNIPLSTRRRPQEKFTMIKWSLILKQSKKLMRQKKIFNSSFCCSCIMSQRLAASIIESQDHL